MINKKNLLKTLPDVLKNDSNMSALADSIAGELAKRPEEISSIKIYTRIDELDEELLDILAEDLKIDWWDYDYSLQEKRQTLKDSWNVRRTLGTKGAVELALSAVYPSAKVSEWFEYGGEPYHFKVLISEVQEFIDPDKHARALERIQFYKNLRSHSDGVEYVAQPSGFCTSYCGIAAAGIGLQMTVKLK